jgi:anti-anti-sigma factor
MRAVERVLGVAVYRVGVERLFMDQEIADFERGLDALLEQERPRVVIDLRRVEALSSRVLGVLVRVRKQIMQAEGRLALFGINPTVRKVLQITKLIQMLEIRDSEDEAVEWARQDGAA